MSNRPPRVTERTDERPWPLVLLAPILVAIVGIAVATAIGALGLSRLADATTDRASIRAEWISTLLGERIGKLDASVRLDAVQLAARRTGAEVVVVKDTGEVTQDATLGAPDSKALAEMVHAGHGEATTMMGRTRYAAAPLPSDSHVFVLSFVRVPRAPEGAPALVQALLALTTLLIGVATVVAYSVARDAKMDISYVTTRVSVMAAEKSEPAGERVPVRTIDEVGALTSAFNELVARFRAAELAYRHDLTRARAADKERAEFLAAVSHELRTPLNAVLGFADVLMSEVDGPLSPDAREEIEQVRQSGAHLSDLVGDILDFSSLEGGKLVLSRAPTDLAAMARELVKESAVLVLDKPVHVRTERADSLVAFVDPKRARQIVGNLLGNAIKFTQSGEVVVKVSRNGIYALIEVRDSGPGITASDQSTIFEAYGQGKGERAKRRGTGLGLTIARRLALMHGGRIELESALGSGSTFRLWLPIEKKR